MKIEKVESLLMFHLLRGMTIFPGVIETTLIVQGRVWCSKTETSRLTYSPNSNNQAYQRRPTALMIFTKIRLER